MRISDWSSDVCSSDLASVGSRTDAMRYQLAQFDIQDCDILFLTSMLQNFAVDIVPIGHFRRLVVNGPRAVVRSEEHTSELQSLMRISYAVFCLKKKRHIHPTSNTQPQTHKHHKIKLTTTS